MRLHACKLAMLVMLLFLWVAVCSRSNRGVVSFDCKSCLEACVVSKLPQVKVKTGIPACPHHARDDLRFPPSHYPITSRTANAVSMNARVSFDVALKPLSIASALLIVQRLFASSSQPSIAKKQVNTTDTPRSWILDQ